MNDLDDSVILGKSYYPENILIINERHRYAVFYELLELEPSKKLVNFICRKYRLNLGL